MNVEELREYVLSLPKVEENQPWTEPQYEMLITYKVGGKWFMLEDPDKKFMATTMKSSNLAIAAMQELMRRRIEAEPQLALKNGKPLKINGRCNQLS